MLNLHCINIKRCMQQAGFQRVDSLALMSVSTRVRHFNHGPHMQKRHIGANEAKTTVINCSLTGEDEKNPLIVSEQQCVVKLMLC